MKTTAFYTLTEVSLHCTPEDLWAAKFGRVYDYTNLIRTSPSGLVEALIKNAGTDITHWFDPKTQDFPLVTDALETRYRLPLGLPMLNSGEKQGQWWRNEQYCIGLLGTERPLQILNSLTLHRHTLMVCEQETIVEIAARYSRFNSNAAVGYRWRFQEKDLEMDKTLTENGIKDEREQYLKLQWPEKDWYIPCIVLVWKDQMV